MVQNSQSQNYLNLILMEYKELRYFIVSYQKPYVEKNHEYIRYILPNGVSLNNLNQEDITLMMNHINSTARASLNGNTPFKLAQMLLDKSLLEKLSLKHIPADEVHLKPALLKK